MGGQMGWLLGRGMDGWMGGQMGWQAGRQTDEWMGRQMGWQAATMGTATMATTMTAAAGMSAAMPLPELPCIQFPLPPSYWDHTGEQLDFRTWWMHYDNYVYWIDAFVARQ